MRMPHIGRRLLTGLLLLLGATQASAQWHIGIEGGYTNNRLARFRTFDYTRQYTARGGFTVALPVRYAFNDWFALQAEVTFLQKNYGLRRIGPRAQEYTDYTNSFLEVPLLARFAFGGERLRGFLHAGGYVGWWASSHNRGQRLLDIPEGVLMPFDQPVAFDARRDNRFEAGLLAGVGIAYRLSPRIELSAEVRYLYGLTDLQKPYMLRQVPRYNDTWICRLGILFTLPCRH